MTRTELMHQLIRTAAHDGLLHPEDTIYSFNRLLDVLELDDPSAAPETVPLPDPSLPEPARYLEPLLDDAVARGVIEDYVSERDILDARMMDALMARPSEIIRTFDSIAADDPEAATDWYYALARNSHYIRKDRIRKDIRRTYDSPYGTLDITINLSKPEKDPRAIAAGRTQVSSGYPKCALCKEAEGYRGHTTYAGRANHRIIPLDLGGEGYYLQYSPYVYYPEHCIVLNSAHVPMVIDRRTFARLLDFITVLPHYFVGSNADLPIVGGSILAHDHYQGGHYRFAMDDAEVLTTTTHPDALHVTVETLNWPLSVIRLRAAKPHLDRLLDLADRILTAWRGYDDEDLGILHRTNDEPHNTVTPIARRRGTDYELDLVLRNNRCSTEHPLGIFHPHSPYHHIKKENIGLIEVMGLAVLPARLRDELAAAATHIAEGTEYRMDEATRAHAEWLDQLAAEGRFDGQSTKDALLEILYTEAGRVFTRVLENAGVFKGDAAGRAGLARFLRVLGFTDPERAHG